MAREAHLVGIDLGTTHTVVARAEGSGGGPEVVPIAQLVADGQVEARPLLPSVLFAPPPGETTFDAWDDAPWVLGEHARARGQRVPGRAVLSPKSWLSHAAVDRLAATLPWGGDATDPTLPRVSPVEASRRILEHVRRAYDDAHPAAPLAEQSVVLTVPASFDEVARELTVRAAAEAGLRVRLLEEPLAAFYDYLGQRGTAELAALLTARGAGAAHVLVCDVGGGTTDLTLVRVTHDASGALRLDRVAVGRHLLLGGDNMDLALAHLVESRLVEPPDRLDPALFSELVLACRSGKERLLAPEAPDGVPIRLLSRGSQLVGRTLAAELGRDEAATTVVDGFFPLVGPDAAPRTARAGLVGFGLPYEQDPAVTRHVAAFLRRHLPAGAAADAVLLNGGVFRSALVRARLVASIAREGGAAPVELPAPDPDLAVARGAVAFGLSLAGRGPRVGGGSARGYYVGLAGAEGERRAICVVPRGAAEGERHVVAVPGLTLVVGQPVRFDLFSSDTERHAPGVVVPAHGLDALPSMTAAFDAQSGDAGGRIAVHLEGELSAVGTVDVACVPDAAPPASASLAPSPGTARPAATSASVAPSPGVVPRQSVAPPSGSAAPAATRYRLAFDLKPRAARPPSLVPRSVRPSDAKLGAAKDMVVAVFGKGRPDAEAREARHLLRDLEKLLGDRAGWNIELSRGIADALLPEAKARRRSLDHERTFWMLAGFCLRPGTGHPLDETRVGRLVPLHTELLGFPEEARGWQQFWIAWRRVAFGLGEPMQIALRDLVDPFLSTDEVKPKKRKGMKPQAEPEMLDLAASLESVPAARRADLGRWILERTWTSRDPRLWAALGRVGARVPAFASAHHVVSPATAERWLDHLMREKWGEVPTAARAAVQMARVTGDRTRDVSENLRREIARRLDAASCPLEWSHCVLELVPPEQALQTEFLGESLPVGLELRA